MHATTMNCDERANLIPLYAAGACDAAERDELRAHLAQGCPVCAGAVAEAQATLALIPASLTPIAPSAAAKLRLMDRIRHDAATASPRSLKLPPPTPSRRAPFVPMSLAAMIAAAIGAAAVYSVMATRQRDLRTQLTETFQEVSRTKAELNSARDSIRFLRAPDLRVAELSGTPDQPKAGLRIFWDPHASTWTVVARDLKALPAGKAYELWYFEKDNKVPVAVLPTFKPDASGSVVVTLNIPKDLGPLVLAAITDERQEGVPAPAGTVQAAGKLLALP